MGFIRTFSYIIIQFNYFYPCLPSHALPTCVNTLLPSCAPASCTLMCATNEFCQVHSQARGQFISGCTLKEMSLASYQLLSVYKSFQVRLKPHEPLPFSLTSCLQAQSCGDLAQAITVAGEQKSVLVLSYLEISVLTLHFQSHIPCASWCPLSLGSIVQISQGESMTIMEGASQQISRHGTRELSESLGLRQQT